MTSPDANEKPLLRIVVCSFHNEAATRESALARGADIYLTKPISPRDLYRVLRPPDIESPDLGGSDRAQP